MYVALASPLFYIIYYVYIYFALFIVSHDPSSPTWWYRVSTSNFLIDSVIAAGQGTVFIIVLIKARRGGH